MRYVFVAKDYDQIEMRVAAHYAKSVSDANPMISYHKMWKGKKGRRLISRASEKNHLWDGFVAGIVDGVKFDPHTRMVEISGLPRRAESAGVTTVKNFNFARLYGITKKGLMREYGWDGATAIRNIRYWDEAFPELAHLRCFVEKVLNERGWMANEFGRRYYVDRAYLGLNYLIQGCAGDLLKRALNRCYTLARDLEEEHEGPTPMYVTLNVHDEILFEIREDLLGDTLLSRMDRCMTHWTRNWEDIDDVTSSPLFSVPITTGVEVGVNDWGHMIDLSDYRELKGGDHHPV